MRTVHTGSINIIVSTLHHHTALVVRVRWESLKIMNVFLFKWIASSDNLLSMNEVIFFLLLLLLPFVRSFFISMNETLEAVSEGSAYCSKTSNAMINAFWMMNNNKILVKRVHTIIVFHAACAYRVHNPNDCRRRKNFLILLFFFSIWIQLAFVLV